MIFLAAAKLETISKITKADKQETLRMSSTASKRPAGEAPPQKKQTAENEVIDLDEIE